MLWIKDLNIEKVIYLPIVSNKIILILKFTFASVITWVNWSLTCVHIMFRHLQKGKISNIVTTKQVTLESEA